MIMEGSNWICANDTVDWTNHNTVHIDSDLVGLLGHMCDAAQKGVERLMDKGAENDGSLCHSDSITYTIDGDSESKSSFFNGQKYFDEQEKGQYIFLV